MNEFQQVVAASWRRDKPLVETHVGDLAWWSRETDARRRLWRAGREGVAWGWISGNDLSFHVRADRRGAGYEDDILRWFDGPSAWALDRDAAKVAALERAGFSAVPRQGFHHLVRDLDHLPQPSVPPGYEIRHVTDDDIRRRVAAQRAAFTSTMTEEKYGRLRRTWPYRETLDVVVEAPDGSFASFCLAWLDEENRAGELEPVGTHPEHQRRGLATAASLEALQRLRNAGADVCVVYAADRPDYSAPLGLYTGIGFQPRACHIRYER